MSVIVMGAELPKGYDDCWYLQCDSWKDCYINGIRNDCPLRPLPNVHGDLIDRDALPPSRVEWEDVVNAPAIVGAEGGRTD